MHPRRAYIVLTILYNLGLSFTFTSYVPYLVSLGLAPSDVSLVNMWFVVAGVVCELPTGIFADRVSRVWSIRLGFLITMAGAFFYATATGFWTSLIYEVLVGIGMAFISGAFSAWIKDALSVRGEDAAYRATVTTAAQLQSLSILVGGVIGGFIGTWSFRATWILTGVFVFSACVVAFRNLREERPATAKSTSMLRPLLKSWGMLRQRRGLAWAVAAAMSFGLVLPFNHYWAPYFDSFVGATGRTLLWVPMHTSLAAGAWLVRRSTVSAQHESYAVVVAIICTGLGLALLTKVPGISWPVICLVLHELGRGAFQPILEMFIQRRVESAYRATYGSLQSFLARIAYVIILGSVTWWAHGRDWDITLISHLWTVTGCSMVAIACLLWVRRPHPVED